MNVPLRAPVKFDIKGLVQAIADNQTEDRFAPNLTSFHWELLSSYMQPFALMPGQKLIERAGLRSKGIAGQERVG